MRSVCQIQVQDPSPHVGEARGRLLVQLPQEIQHWLEAPRHSCHAELNFSGYGTGKVALLGVTGREGSFRGNFSFAGPITSRFHLQSLAEDAFYVMYDADEEVSQTAERVVAEFFGEEFEGHQAKSTVRLSFNDGSRGLEDLVLRAYRELRLDATSWKWPFEQLLLARTDPTRRGKTGWALYPREMARSLKGSQDLARRLLVVLEDVWWRASRSGVVQLTDAFQTTYRLAQIVADGGKAEDPRLPRALEATEEAPWSEWTAYNRNILDSFAEGLYLLDQGLLVLSLEALCARLLRNLARALGHPWSRNTHPLDERGVRSRGMKGAERIVAVMVHG